MLRRVAARGPVDGRRSDLGGLRGVWCACGARRSSAAFDLRNEGLRQGASADVCSGHQQGRQDRLGGSPSPEGAPRRTEARFAAGVTTPNRHATRGRRAQARWRSGAAVGSEPSSSELGNGLPVGVAVLSRGPGRSLGSEVLVDNQLVAEMGEKHPPSRGLRGASLSGGGAVGTGGGS